MDVRYNSKVKTSIASKESDFSDDIQKKWDIAFKNICVSGIIYSINYWNYNDLNTKVHKEGFTYSILIGYEFKVYIACIRDLSGKMYEQYKQID